MGVLRRLVPFVLAIGVSTCGGDSTGPTAGSVTGIFGDNDSASTGGTLNVGFTVLGGDGFPLRGARVNWTVTPTAAAVANPASQTSDSEGLVATAVRVGTTPGAFTVTASVNGVAPITFHLRALDPCAYLAPYTLGDTVSGALARTDCRIVVQTRQGPAISYYDFYRLDLPAGQRSIRINEFSSGANKIDPYVELYRLTGELVGADDDIVPVDTQTSQLDVILGSGGSFVIGATAFDYDTIGPYTLTVNDRPTTLAGCREVWMTPGAIITDTIRTTDCKNGTIYSDGILMLMYPSEVIAVAERSTALNPRLTLYNYNFDSGAFDSVAANDDSASGNPNAYISYAVPGAGFYLLEIGTATPGDTGEYTLAFSAATTGPTVPKSSALDRVLPILPRGTFRGWKRQGRGGAH